MNSEYQLEVFREPVRRYLFSEVRKYGHKPEEIEIMINRSISLAMIEVQKTIKENTKTRYVPPPPRLIRAQLGCNARAYVLAVLSQDNKFSELRDIIRSYNSIFVVGAGISARPGVPLVKDLKPVLDFCGVKEYSELAADETRAHQFKVLFDKACESKNVGTSHKLIAENFGNKIIHIICFNWDNLIEKAANLTNKIIPKVNMETYPLNEKGYLWKFHGDVELITKDNKIGHGGWVFPEEESNIFDCFFKYVKDKHLREAFFAVVIVGYSERDGGKVDKVIESFERNPPRPTYRIVVGLEDLDKSNHLGGPSDYVLQRIL